MPQEKIRVLVADRNGNIRNFLKRELINRGYEVTLVPDGDELIREMQAPFPPELVIMDLAPPLGNGPQVLDKLKQGKSKVPVIVFTSQGEYRGDPAVSHARACVDKDCDFELLMQTVESVLASARQGPVILSG